MAAKKLYPPHLSGTIPAFYGNILKVPFSMNKAVSKGEVHGMQLKIKTVQGDAYIVEKAINVNSVNPVGSYITFDPNCIAVFDFSEELADFNFKIGQYYKIQIAYINKGEQQQENPVIGYFSTVGVVKYTAQPTVSIDGLEIGSNNINMHQYDYIGRYVNTIDLSEKEYSYKFNLYDNYSHLISTTDWKVHNSELDESIYESYDIYNIAQDLESNKSYFLEYIVETQNGLQVSTGKYRIMQKKSIDPEIKADLVAELNYENGYVNLNLIGHTDEYGVEYAATGSFKILRASEEDGYATWNEILRFALYGQQPSRWIWKDFTVKQGVTYKYALQQYNEILSSNRLESKSIYVDFEHSFLYDGEKQLKIKYNPKVASFKNDILESKMDTIGGQHPFIFRNGNVKYKEFSISGLISFKQDEEFLFVDEKDVGRYDGTSNLIGENIASEREYKLKVLDWLNNGQPKVFRSPSEGNYIVRLLNVSMTPNDQLGRMLHTFTATAYEIAEYNYQNLNELGLISVGDPTVAQLRWETIELNKLPNLNADTNLLNYKAVSLRLEGLIPGEKLYINDGIVRKGIHGNDEEQPGYDITIGATGSYIIDLAFGTEITEVKFKSDYPENNPIRYQGSLTYAYYSKIQNVFDSISNVAIVDEPLEQYIGYHNIIKEIEDVKVKIQDFYWIHCSLRDIHNIYCTKEKQDNIDLDSNNIYCTKEELDNMDLDPYCLYLVREKDSNQNAYYLDGNSRKKYELDDYSSQVIIDYREVDFENTNKIPLNLGIVNLEGIKEYTIKHPKDIKTLVSKIGVMVEVAYQKQVLEYSVETEPEIYLYENLSSYKKDQQDKYNILDQYINLADNEIFNKLPEGEIDIKDVTKENSQNRPFKIKQYTNEYKEAYNKYINKIEEALKEKGASQGDIV